MKKVITFVLIITMTSCVFCGCGKSNKKKTSKNTSKETTENISTLTEESESFIDDSSEIQTSNDETYEEEFSDETIDLEISPSEPVSENLSSDSDTPESSDEIILDITPNYNTESAPVYAKFIEDTTEDTSGAYQFSADSSDCESNVVFFANETVTNFQFTSLESYENTETGGVDYIATPMYSIDEFDKETPLVVTMSFFGTIPTYGISYTDASGAQKNFSVSISGMDGSLVISEY